MIASGMIGFLCGLLLGSRFRVFSILLAQALAMAATLFCAAFEHYALWQALGGLLCWSFAMQSGYVVMLALASRTSKSLRATALRA
jgi:hypothetical protein